ncbi:ACP S-malonyltransferase [Burkholderia oklahomensis]|uniref:ACP S-malonyltransferase n=1 Tax=Burkholderia oklahomensis TaxID=342113 RepID=UPI00016A78E1|nr:ACP S-malonyltransferase [Burkholderia oklahomensis]AJX34592.1 malonyl CoA-acyl carrier protein transacylase [Burkholderia oklahomensis C6786]AOI49765.1 malonyl CoA-ACP transacylase [Burkholderia oklahomensis C6786]KUY52811.1 malonyl CoA-ACP transacylase [Burkholderia oklahomensis C6786]MBI0361932.1 ACP S-malonyltransferase [Burkholderia oklahomensis]SUY28882.1 Polyketide biosynthesis malonyl CoA-acyl carrier protein transacylase BaeC [Burkholderia oklahomensis]
MKALIFPGQGSQAAGMGAGLFERYPEIVEAADDVMGLSVARLCIDDPDGLLAGTRHAQPAIFVVNALQLAAWRETHDDANVWLAGHSLGEYSALLAAGVFDFRTGLEIVKRRGELFASVDGGGMAAVVGAAAAELRRRLRESGFDDVDLANFNSAEQTVIAGPAASVADAARMLDACGDVTVHPLKVSGAFHSRRMTPLKPEFDAFLARFALAEPARPVVSNVTARPYQAPGTPADYLVEQLDQPVRWRDSIRFMLRSGVDEWDELGPGRRILTKLVDAIRHEEPATLQPATL